MTALAPITHDAELDRTTIPLPNGWKLEVSKAKGGSVVLYEPNRFGYAVTYQPNLFELLERMAREIHAACSSAVTERPAAVSKQDNPQLRHGIDHAIAKKAREVMEFGDALDPNAPHNRWPKNRRRNEMSEFAQYRRSQIAELRPYIEGEVLSERVSVSASDREAGSPKLGDMIARNPKNHSDQWLVAAKYFADNFELVAAVSARQVPDEKPETWCEVGDDYVGVTHPSLKNACWNDGWNACRRAMLAAAPVFVNTNKDQP